MDISVVITALNEEKTISKLLNSLLIQSKKASEIVIVDGGSTDKTIEIIVSYAKKNNSVKLLKEQGSIAQGRNEGIKEAKNSIIVFTDAGCVAKKNWLEKLTAPFEDEKVDFVAGFYEMTGNLPIQKAVASFFGIPLKKYNPNKFLPSTRSMALKKSVLEKVGGFSETLVRAGEDTLLNYEIIRLGIKPVRVKDAIVYWEMPKNMGEIIKKFYHYAEGDAQVGVWWNPIQGMSTHNLKILTIFARYILFTYILSVSIKIAMLFIILYIFWPIYKMRNVVLNPQAKIWLPVIQISSDLAVMTGFVIGLLKGKK